MLKKKSVNSRQISDVNSTISLSLSFWIIHNSDDLKGGGNTTMKTFLLQLILGNDMKLSVTYTIKFSSMLSLPGTRHFFFALFKQDDSK